MERESFLGDARRVSGQIERFDQLVASELMLAAVRDAVTRLLQDPALRSRLGEQAQDVAAEWSWTRVVDIQEELYERIAGRP